MNRNRLQAYTVFDEYIHHMSGSDDEIKGKLIIYMLNYGGHPSTNRGRRALNNV